jgi:hypothetical protein
LLVYSTLLTAVFAFTVFAAVAPARKTSFEEIDVQRINVVEPDGTLRMTISSHARFPGLIVRGEEKPFERPQAGMLFFNDEASEVGGLIFGGRQNEQGEVVGSGGALSFDRYQGNQIVQLIGVHEKETQLAGLIVVDSPPGAEPQRRLFAGTAADGAARLTLADGQGRKRLVLEVAAEGAARVLVYDDKGEVAHELVPGAAH